VTQDERVARKDEYCPTTRSSVPRYSSVVLPFSMGFDEIREGKTGPSHHWATMLEVDER
jgi:hypothetical protein